MKLLWCILLNMTSCFFEKRDCRNLDSVIVNRSRLYGAQKPPEKEVCDRESSQL